MNALCRTTLSRSDGIVLDVRRLYGFTIKGYICDLQAWKGLRRSGMALSASGKAYCGRSAYGLRSSFGMVYLKCVDHQDLCLTMTPFNKYVKYCFKFSRSEISAPRSFHICDKLAIINSTLEFAGQTSAPEISYMQAQHSTQRPNCPTFPPKNITTPKQLSHSTYSPWPSSLPPPAATSPPSLGLSSSVPLPSRPYHTSSVPPFSSL